MKNFTRVPNELLELTEQGKLDCYDIAVYMAIMRHKNEKTGLCNPGMRRIAKLLNISTKTVHKRVNNLKDNRCITCNASKEGVVSEYRTVVSYDIGRCTGNNKSKLNNKTNNNLLNEEDRIRKNIIALEDVKKRFNIKSCPTNTDS